MFPINYKFPRLSYFEKIRGSERTKRRTGCNTYCSLPRRAAY